MLGTELEITIATDDGIELRGSLRLPGSRSSSGGTHAAVLLLPGSGPLDRDSNAGRIRLDLWAPFVDALAGAGIASLRFDRRGIGASGGDHRTCGFIRNREDARAALQTLAGQERIDADRIAVLGHSEGALHAASLGASEDPAAVVMLAGFASTGVEAILWQLDRLVATMPAALRPLALAQRLVMQRRIARLMRIPRPRPREAWWHEMLRFDAAAQLRGISCPLLAITGDRDVQVDPAGLERIAALVPGPVETRREPGLSHLLRRTESSAGVRDHSRQLRLPTDPELASEIAAWLHGSLETGREARRG